MDFKKHPLPATITLSFLLILFVLISLPFLVRPIDGWEWLSHAAASQVAERGIPATSASCDYDSLLLMHPPLAVYTMGLGQKLFGGGTASMRLTGLLIGMAVVIALFLLTRSVAAAGAVVTALWLTNPAAVQGALYLQFGEGTILPLGFILFAWAWIRHWNRPLLIQTIALGLPMALCLWSRVSTSLALPVALWLASLFLYRYGEMKEPWAVSFKKSFRVTLAATFFGGGIFLFTWSFFVFIISRIEQLSFAVLWQIPFRYIVIEGTNGILRFSEWDYLQLLATPFVRITLYFGFYLIFWALAGYVMRFREFMREKAVYPSDLMYILTVAVAIPYLIITGGTGPFPKYHLAILPFLCFFALKGISGVLSYPKSPSVSIFLSVFAAGFLYYVFIIGDLGLIFNHSLRWAVYLGEGEKDVFLKLAGKGAVYAIFPFIAGGVLKFLFHVKSQGRIVMLACLFSSQIALIFLQATGGYFLCHLYGSPLRDTAEVLRILEAETDPRGTLMALSEYAYSSGRRLTPGFKRPDWCYPSTLARVIREEAPAAVIYGLPTHTLEQMKCLAAHPDFVAALNENYRRCNAGEFEMWIKKPKQHYRSPEVMNAKGFIVK